MPNNDNISKLYGAYSQVYDNFKNEDEMRGFINNASDEDIQNLFDDFSAEYDNFDKDGIDGFKQYINYKPQAATPTPTEQNEPVTVDGVTGAAKKAPVEPAQPTETDKVEEFYIKKAQIQGVDLSVPENAEMVRQQAESTRNAFNGFPQAMYDALVKNGGDYKAMAAQIANNFPMYTAQEIENAFVNSGMWNKVKTDVSAKNKQIGDEPIYLAHYDADAEAEMSNQKYVYRKNGAESNVQMLTYNTRDANGKIVPTVYMADENGNPITDTYDEEGNLVGKHGFTKVAGGMLRDSDTGKLYRPEDLVHQEYAGIPLDGITVTANKKEFDMSKQLADNWAIENKIDPNTVYPMEDGTKMLGKDLVDDMRARFQMGIQGAFVNAFDAIGGGADPDDMANMLSIQLMKAGLKTSYDEVRDILNDPIKIDQAKKEFERMLLERVEVLKKREQDKFDEASAKVVGNVNKSNFSMAPEARNWYYKSRLDQDPERLASLAKMSLLNDIKDTIEAGVTGQSYNGIDQIVLATKHGINAGLRSMLFQEQDINSEWEMYNAIERARSGKGSEEDNLIAELYGIKGTVEQRFADNIGIAYNVHRGLGYSIPFMAQAWLSSATGVARGMTQFGEKLFTVTGKRALGKFLVNALPKSVITRGLPYIGKGVGYLTGSTVEALLQTLAFGLEDIEKDAVERMIGNIGLHKEGNKFVADFSQDSNRVTDIWEARRQAGTANFLERYSEYLGELFSPLTKIFRSVGAAGIKATGRGLGKVGFKEMGDWMITLTNKDFQSGFNQFLKNIKFHGTIGEYGEEVLNNVLNAALVGDMNFSTDPNDPNYGNSVFNPDVNLETFLSCAYMTGVFGVVGAVNNQLQRSECEATIKDQSKYLSRLMGEEQWRKMEVELAAAKMEDVGRIVQDNLAKFAQQGNQEAANAYYKYAAATMALEGMEMGTFRQGVVDASEFDKMHMLAEMKKKGREIEELEVGEPMYNEGDVIETHNDDMKIYVVKDLTDEVGEGNFKVVVEWKDETAPNGKRVEEAVMDKWQLNDLNKVPRMPKEVFTGEVKEEPVQKVDDRLTDEENKLVSDNGNFVTALMPSRLPNDEGKNEQKVWIYHGNLVTGADGNIDVANSDQVIVWMDQDGYKTVGKPSDFIQKQNVQTTTIDEYVAERDAENIQEELDNTVQEQATTTETPAVETSVTNEAPTTQPAAQAPVTGIYQEVSLKGDVKIVDGNRYTYQSTSVAADGTITNTYTNGLGEGYEFPATEEQLAAQAANNANAELEAEAQRQATAQATAQEVANEGIQFKVGDELTGTATIDGEKTTGKYYVDSVNEDGTLNVSFEDDATGDITQTEGIKPSELNSMLDNPVTAEANKKVAPQATPEVVQAPREETTSEPVAATAPVVEEAMTPEEQTLAADAQEASAVQADLEGIIEDAGGNMDIAAQDVQATIDDIQAQLDEVGQRVAKRVSRAAGNEQALAERRKALEEQRQLQQQLAHWQDVQDALNLMNNPAQEQATAPVEEAPVATEPVAETTNETPVAETPTVEEPVQTEAPTTTETPAQTAKPKEDVETMNARVKAEIEAQKQKENETQRNEAHGNIKKMRKKADLLINLAHQFGLEVRFEELNFKTRADQGHQKTRVLTLNPNASIAENVKKILGHEITHTTEGTQAYKALVDYAKTTETFGNWIKSYRIGKQTFGSLQEAAAALVQSRADYALRHNDPTARVNMQGAMNEIMADFFGENLFSNDSFVKSMMREVPESKGLIQKIVDAIKELLAAFDEKTEDNEELSKMADLMTNALYNIDVENAEEKTNHSIDTLGEALGFRYEKDAGNGETILTDEAGQPVTEFNVDMVKQSRLGAIIGAAINDGKISLEQAEKQCQFFADLINMMIKTKDMDMVYAVSSQVILMDINKAKRDAELQNKYLDEKGSIRQREFVRDYERKGIVAQAGITGNADPQYSVTIDWTTICTKTQSIINTMTQVMKDRKRGLTSDEIVEIVYDEVNKGGEQVPCPVCYVFSRWLNLGKLFDNMAELQAKYGDNMEGFVAKYGEEALSDEALVQKWKDEQAKSVAKRYTEVQKQADAYCEKMAKEKPDDFKNVSSPGDRRAKYFKLIEGEWYGLQQKRTEKLFNKKAKGLDAKERARLRELEQQMQLINEFSWFTNVRLTFGTDGTIRAKEDYKDIPLDVLYDINASEEFSTNYPLQWKYRTTRGSGMGKAAYSYSPMHIGQVIQGTNNVKSAMNLGNNPFLNLGTELDVNGYRALDKKAMVALRNAQKKAVMQNWLNGQRLQSTSDFRFEFGLDYLMAQLEEQALGAYEQMYMKVPEGAPFMAATGAEINLSLVGKGAGFKPVSRAEVLDHPEKHPFAVNVGGEFYELIFSKVTGIDEHDAFDLADTYDNVQPILIGFSPTHMRVAMRDSRITFIIPYHASGLAEARYDKMMEELGEKEDGRIIRDFSPYQNDLMFVSGEAVKLDKNGDPVYDEEGDVVMTGVKAKKLPQAEWEEFWSRHSGKVAQYISPEFLLDDNGQPLSQEALFDRMSQTRKLRTKLFSEAAGMIKGDVITEEAIAQVFTPEDMKLIGMHPMLAKIFNMLYQDQNNMYYGMSLKKAQQQLIMSHEYWDETTTYGEDDYINSERFVAYSLSMGAMPRFSGWVNKGKGDADIQYNPEMDFTDEVGYWKTLIDRSMYNTAKNGDPATRNKYHEQRPVELSALTEESEYGDSAGLDLIGFRQDENGNAVSARTIQREKMNARRPEDERGRETQQFAKDPQVVQDMANKSAARIEAKHEATAKRAKDLVNFYFNTYRDRQGGLSQTQKDKIDKYDAVDIERLLGEYDRLKGEGGLYAAGNIELEGLVDGLATTMGLDLEDEKNVDIVPNYDKAVTILKEIKKAIDRSTLTDKAKKPLLKTYENLKGEQAVIEKLRKQDAAIGMITKATGKRMEKFAKDIIEMYDANGEFVTNSKNFSTKVGNILRRDFNEEYDRGTKHSIAPEAPVAEPGESPMVYAQKMAKYNTELQADLERRAEIASDGGVKHSIVTDTDILADLEPQLSDDAKEMSVDEVRRRLEAGEPLGRGYVTLYRAARLISGRLYSPKMTKLKGEGNEVFLGKVEKSDEKPEIAFPKTLKDGTIKWKVNLDGGDPTGSGLKKRSTNGVDYNPYLHCSTSMLNDQFTAAYDMPEMVVVETRVPLSHLESKYKADKAASAVGFEPWRSGTIDTALPGEQKRGVCLTSYDMPVGIVDENVVLDNIAKLLKDNNLSIPFNLVTPSVAEGLVRRGVQVTDKVFGIAPSPATAEWERRWAEQRAKIEGTDPTDPTTPGGGGGGRTRHSIAEEPDTYGVPYVGSKNKIAKEIVDLLPEGKRFVDLFAGGGALTHAAMLSGKYDNVRMNDLVADGMQLFLDGIDGKYRDYEADPTFNIDKGNPARYINSFAGGGYSTGASVADRQGSRIKRVQSLEALQPLRGMIDTSVGDYRDVQFNSDDVLYADIPYINTNGKPVDKRMYDGNAASFDYNAFSQWAQEQDQPVYVSFNDASGKYLKGFTPIWSKEIGGMRAGQKKMEYVLVQDKFADQAKATAEQNQTKHSISTEDDPWMDMWDQLDAEQEQAERKMNEQFEKFGLNPKGKNMPWVEELAKLTPENVANMFVGTDAYHFRTYFSAPEIVAKENIGNEAFKAHVQEIYEAAKQCVDKYAQQYNTIAPQTMTQAQAEQRIDDIDYTAERYTYDREPFFRYLGKKMLEVNETNKKALNDGTLTRAPKGHDLGVKYGTATHKDIDALFKGLNTSKTLAKLYKRVSAITQKLDIPFYITNIRNASGQSFYSGRVEFDYDYLNNEDISDQEKASTLLHELIHQATTYALDTFEYDSNMLDADMRRACREIKSIWRQVRKLGKEYGISLYQSGRGDYATKDVHEFAAEMSNLNWREKLKSAGLWEKMKAAIKRLFKLDAPETNTEQRMAKLLDYVLDNFDEMAYWNFRNNHSGSNAMNAQETIANTGNTFTNKATQEEIASASDLVQEWLTDENRELVRKVSEEALAEWERPMEELVSKKEAIIKEAERIKVLSKPLKTRKFNKDMEPLSPEEVQTLDELTAKANELKAQKQDVEERIKALNKYRNSNEGKREKNGITINAVREVMSSNGFVAVAYLDGNSLNIFEGVEDPKVYSDDAYFVDHAVNHHNNIDSESYKFMQQCLSDPDYVMQKQGHDSFTFVKLSGGRSYQVTVKRRGNIITYMNFYHQDTLPDMDIIKSKRPDGTLVNGSPEDGESLIVNSNESGSSLSDLHGDGAKVGNSVETTKQNDENLSGEGQNLTVDGVKHSIDSAQTHTENFKNWFGDWENDPEHASKVVDEEGKPLVVYHGTMGNEWDLFNVFQRGMFASNKDVAKYFNGDEFERPGKTYEVYLDIKKPFVFDAQDFEWNRIPMEKELADKMGIKDDGEYHDASEKEAWHDAGHYLVRTNDIVEALKQNPQGYDGVIIENVLETDYADVPTTDYAVLKPSQIKSATANNGNFDRNDPDIRHSIVGEVGAERADALDGGNRIENLSIAKEMLVNFGGNYPELSKEEQLRIKLATGWDKGADGKWRYEIGDGKLTFNDLPLPNKDKQVVTNLEQVLDNPELFDMYPELKETTVVSLPLQERGGYANGGLLNMISLGHNYFVPTTRKGARMERELMNMSDASEEELDKFIDEMFDEDGKKPEVTHLKSGEAYRVLIHEVQHLIQGIEGFEKGTMFTEAAKLQNTRYNDALRIRDYAESNGMSLSEAATELLKHPFELADRGTFIYATDKKIQSIIDEGNEEYKKYLNKGGEVEARNAEKRLRMTLEQRRGTLLSQTEDVPRSEQRFGTKHSIDLNEESAPTSYEARVAKAYNVAQRAVEGFAANGNNRETQEEGRNAVAAFIRTALSKEDMPMIGKLQLTKIMSLVKDVKSAKMLSRHLIAAQNIVATAEEGRLLKAVNNLLKLKKQGKNSKGVSIAKLVDDRTRMLFDYMKGITKELLDTPVQKEIDAINEKIRNNKNEIASLMLDQDSDRVLDYIAKLEKENDDLTKEKEELFKIRQQQRDQNVAEAMRDWEKRLAILEKKMNNPEYDSGFNNKNELTDAELDEYEALTILKLVNDARLIGSIGIGENEDHQPGIEEVEALIVKLKSDNAQLRASLHTASEADKEAIRDQIKAVDASITNCNVMINALKAQQIQLLTQAYESLNEMVENGRQKLKEELKAEADRRKEIVQNTLDDIWKGKHSKEGQEKSDKKRWRKVFDTFLLRPSLSFEFMSQWLSNRIGGRGYLYRKFTRDLIRSEENFAQNIDRTTEKLNEACREIFGCNFKTAAERYSGKPQNTGIYLKDPESGKVSDTPVEMNKGVALQFWMWWQNKDGEMKMRNMGYDEESIVQLERFLGEDMLQFGAYLFKFYEEMGDRVNEVHKMLYHTSMHRHEYYSPLKIDKRDVKQETSLSEGTNTFAQTLNKINGSLINRTVNLKRLSYMYTAFDIVSDHVMQQEELIAFSRVRKDMDYMLSSPTVKKVLNANKTGQYDDFVEACMVAGHLTKYDATPLDEGISAIMSGFAGGAIGWRLWTGCKQIMSYPAFYAYKGDLTYAKDVTARFFSILQAKPKVWAANIEWAKENLPLFKARWNEGLAGNQDVLREVQMLEDEGGFYKLMAKYSQYGMLWNRFVDAMTCAAGARAIYDFEYRRIKKALISQGLSTEEAHEQAHNEALMCANNYNTTQQSTVKTFISADQDSKTLINRCFGLFQNSNRGFTRQGYIGARDMLKAAKASNRSRWIEQYMNDFNVDKKQAEKMLNEDIRTAVNKFVMCGFGIKWIWDRTQGLGKAALLTSISPAGGTVIGASVGAVVGASVGSKFGHAATGAAVGGTTGAVTGGILTGVTLEALKEAIKLFVDGMMDGGDDDDDKNEETAIGYDLLMFGMKAASFYAQGSPAGNAAHDIVWNQRYSSPMSIMGTNELSIAERLYEKYGASSAVLGACANIFLAWRGIKMDTWSSIMMGVEDLIRQGEDADIAMDVMLILNCPKSMRVDVAKDLYANYSPADYARVMAKANKIIEGRDSEFLNSLLYQKSLDEKKKKQFVMEWVERNTDEQTKAQFKEAEAFMKEVSSHSKNGKASKEEKKAWKEQNRELVDSGRAANLKTIKSALDKLNKCLVNDCKTTNKTSLNKHAAQVADLKRWAVEVMNGQVYDQKYLDDILNQAKEDAKNLPEDED